MPNQIGISHKQNLEADLVAGTSKVKKFDVDAIDSFFAIIVCNFCMCRSSAAAFKCFILLLKGIPIMHMYARMCV